MTEQVARRCREADSDERTLRIALIEDLRSRVPFRAHVWALIDPETEVATAPLASVPDALMTQLPGVIRRRYMTTVNRWDRMDAPVASLYHTTDGDPAKSLLRREVLGPAVAGRGGGHLRAGGRHSRCRPFGPASAAPFAVGAWIGGAYFFTSSTSFANPAVTLGRTLSNTFAGIRPASAPMFIVMQVIGGVLAVAAVRVLYPRVAEFAGDVVLPHLAESSGNRAHSEPVTAATGPTTEPS